MKLKELYLKTRRAYFYLITSLCYRPFLKESRGKFIVIKPIVFNVRHFIIGKNVFIRNFARLEAITIYRTEKFDPLIDLHDNVTIEQNLHLTCANHISIGANTALAANVTITDIIHPYENVNLAPENQQIKTLPVIIDENCKIYNNVVILPGTHLGKHNIVGANTVVSGKVYPDYSLIVGAPSRIIKRYSFEQAAWLKTDAAGNFIE